MKKKKIDNFFGDKFHKTVFMVCLLVSIVLLLVSWIMPPAWIIDKSILAAVGELFGFAALGQVAAAIERGKTAKIQHNNTSLTIGEDEEEIPPYECDYPEENNITADEM